MPKTPSSETPRQKLERLLKEVHDLARVVNPIDASMAANVPTWRAAYSDRTSALMATFCAIAYERFEDKLGAELEAMREKLAGAGFTLVNTYNPNACTQAFLAVGHDFAVLAFRGTNEPADWKVNFNSGLVPLDPKRPAVKVHAGFLEAFRVVEDDIRRDIDAHVPPTLGLYITGHSLGGALAQIASAAYARDNLAACYTYGSPRVGAGDFDLQVKCPLYRVVNAWDLVPGVPPPLWFGYQHAGDPRTLHRMGDLPSRRNRSARIGFCVTVAAVLLYPLRGKFFPISQHMIWNYQDKLDAVAPKPPETTAPATAAPAKPWPGDVTQIGGLAGKNPKPDDGPEAHA
ncbi:MAG: lipase family protein [Phenylobacterium sp.]|nr:lipase family protein [Phenylobacterium sp.]